MKIVLNAVVAAFQAAADRIGGNLLIELNDIATVAHFRFRQLLFKRIGYGKILAEVVGQNKNGKNDYRYGNQNGFVLPGEFRWSLGH